MRTLISLILLLLSVPCWGALEDFATYTEVDPGNDVTVAANSLTMLNCYNRNTDTYVYDDKGAAHFSADFTHRLKINVGAGSATYAMGYFWCLANTVDDLKDIDDASGDFHTALAYKPVGAWEVRLRICENGSLTDDTYSGLNAGTDYYIQIERDDDGGANSTGQLKLYLCTTNYYGDAGAVLVDTLTVDCAAGEQNDFQYVYGLQSYDSGSPLYDFDGTFSDLNLSPDAGGGQVIIVGEDE
jgi:hypothetical protein